MSATYDIATIGALVRERRKANGFSQQQLGELAGVGTRFISELERGKGTVRIDAVNRVLAVFGKTLGVVPARREAIEVGDDSVSEDVSEDAPADDQVAQ